MYLPENTMLHGGTYRIIRFISAGGFGCTYEAEHVMLRKRVAIKEFFVKDFCNRDETTSQVTLGITAKKALVDKLRNKFLDEARGVSRLHYPGIVSVSDVFEENGTAYFVMGYVDGKSLGDMVKEEGFLSEERAVGYIKKVSEALRYVHENNRLHLDIKPGNIMVDSNDNPVLIDFGASKQYDEEGGENTSTLLGKTPGYAPLEQMSNSVVKFLPATDIYALGATLYKLLTGITPPDSLLRGSGEKLLPLPATISSQTRAAVDAAMQMDKSLRPQTIDQFLGLLNGAAPASQQAVADERTEIAAKPTPESSKQPDPEPKKNRSLLPILIAAGVIIGVLIGFFVMRGLRSDGRYGDIVAQTENADSDSLDHSVVEPAEDNAAARKAEEERLAKEKREREAAEKAEAERKAREEAEKAEAERKAREAAEAKRREEEQKRNSVNIEMVYVAGGTFMMGASSNDSEARDSEKPAHNVTLSSFYIGKYEVTQKQWVEVMGSNPSYFKGDNLPVEQVSWYDIQDFIKKLNAKTGKNYRLPTEAEWEFAARGGNNSRGYKYSGSNDIGSVAWYGRNSDSKTHPVGTKSPNELGIYDMSGNVDEWCADWNGPYSSNSQTNPKGPNSGDTRVVRGSCWRLNASSCRVSVHVGHSPDHRINSYGFRLAMDAR